MEVVQHAFESDVATNALILLRNFGSGGGT
jgi:hypothetical protein